MNFVDFTNVQPRELLQYYAKVKIPECVLQKLEGSRFEHIFKIKMKLGIVKLLIAAMVNSHDMTTRGFQFGQHKLYLGLEDVPKITGLPIDGEPVVS